LAAAASATDADGGARSLQDRSIGRAETALCLTMSQCPQCYTGTCKRHLRQDHGRSVVQAANKEDTLKKMYDMMVGAKLQKLKAEASLDASKAETEEFRQRLDAKREKSIKKSSKKRSSRKKHDISGAASGLNPQAFAAINNDLDSSSDSSSSESESDEDRRRKKRSKKSKKKKKSSSNRPESGSMSSQRKDKQSSRKRKHRRSSSSSDSGDESDASLASDSDRSRDRKRSHHSKKSKHRSSNGGKKESKRRRRE
jgi:hypothetical protein